MSDGFSVTKVAKSAQRVSEAENWRRQWVTLEFSSISIERSRKHSSREVVCSRYYLFD